MADVIVKVGADTSEVEKAYDKIGLLTDDLEQKLSTIAKISAVAWAAFTAEIYAATNAFSENDSAVRSLTTAFKNQNIQSEAMLKSYLDIADHLESLTGVQDEVIIKGQSVLQSFLGQTQITEEMNKRILDLAAGLGVDVVTAYEMVGKTVTTSINAFARQGIQISDTMSRQEKLNAIFGIARSRYDGMSEAQISGIGVTKTFANAVDNLQTDIGRNLAPVIISVTKSVVSFIDAFRKNEELVRFTSAALLVGAAIAGIVATISGATLAINSVIGMLGALGVTVTVAAAPWVALGVAIAAATTAFVAWYNKSKNQSPLEALNEQIETTANKIQSLKDRIATPALFVDKSGLRKDLESLQLQLSGLEEQRRKLESVGNKGGDKGATDSQKIQEANQELLRQSNLAHLEVLKLQNQQASSELIQLKQQESETLKAIAESQNESEKALLQEKLQIQRDAYDTQKAEEQAKREEDDAEKQAIKDEYLAKDEEYLTLKTDQQAQFNEKELGELQRMNLTEKEAKKKHIFDKTAMDIQANNTYLMEQQKYGTAYAMINKMMHSEVMQGTKSAIGEMTQFQQSSNAQLKGIGKAAAIASIAIRTAESAMAIYAGFSTIPIIGQGLGVAGAIAAVAFGAEQIQRVNAAASGALVEGGIPGVDSVPYMLQAGELVVPRKNFNEVITAVTNQRLGRSSESSEGILSQIVIGFDGTEAEQVLTARQVEARALGTIREA